ncbi:MAG: sensor histidine kinase [Pseudomonadota bacterium]
MSLALFPLGAIALWQTNQVIDSSTQLSQEIILAETERAASAERRLLQRAIGAAEGLSALVFTVLDDPTRCSTIMRDFIAQQDTFIFAGFIQANGIMECASAGEVMDFSDRPAFARAMETREQMFEVNRAGTVTQRSVVIISNPVEIDGVLAGFVSLSVPNDLTSFPALRGSEELGLEYVALNQEGRILSATSDLDRAGKLLPADVAPAAFLDKAGETFIGDAIDGRSRVFAVADIIPGQVVVVGSWAKDQAALGLGSGSLWVPLLFPILMWFAGIMVAFLGLHRLVIRHIYDLRGAMRRFALGEREDPKLKLDDPPAEFEVLETSFNRMVQTLMHAEEQAEKDIEEKTILLREIHHRVKNNLQLIASIMNMHARVATAPEARAVLSQLQFRVRGLATVHQTLNSTSDESSVDTKNLLEQLVRELTSVANNLKREVKVSTDIMSIQLGQDQAITMSMLAAEALTNAVKYVGSAEGEVPSISVSFNWVSESSLCFKVVNSIGSDPDQSAPLIEPGGIGSRLMRAFVSQLDGSETREQSDGKYHYAVSFPFAQVTPEPPKPWATDPAQAYRAKPSSL